jgi:hypothetical protein
VIVIADGFGVDAEVVEKLSSVASVFTGDEVDFTENSDRPVRDVFQISDRSGDDVESRGH